MTPRSDNSEFMTSTAKRTFSKRERAFAIGLVSGLIIGAIIGSVTGNLGWWIWLGMTIGICIGGLQAFRLR